MRVLLINGSLRAGDACADALRRAEERLCAAGLETVRFWPVRTAQLPCSGCGACRGAGMCVADPRAGAFLKDAAACDALLFFAPAGLLGVGVDMKNFLERVAALNRRADGRPLAGRCAAALPVGRRSGRAEKQLTALLEGLGLPAPEAGTALWEIIREVEAS